jgi:NitT/TauT family transport system permease protein
MIVQRLRRNPERLLAVLLALVILFLWEQLPTLFHIPAFQLPRPTKVYAALVTGMGNGLYPAAFWVTFQEAGAGFLIGSLSGIVVGALIAQYRIVERTVYPYIVGFQTLPKVAIAPLFVVWLGFDLRSKVLISALVAFFPLLVNVIAGLHSTDRERVDMMRAFSASNWQIFRMLRLPNALPFVFVGLELAAVFSVIGAVVGEFVGSQAGLGYLIQAQNFTLDVAGMFACLLLLAVLGLGFHLVVRLASRMVVFWKPIEEEVIGA